MNNLFEISQEIRRVRTRFFNSNWEFLKKEIRLLQDKFRPAASEALNIRFKEFFEKHPIVEKVLWTQFTPYFADGDPCVFSVNDFELRFFKNKLGNAVVSQHYIHEDEGRPSYGEYYDLDSLGPEHHAALKDLSEFSSQCYDIEPLLKDVFGDHCLVVATAQGFKVSEYEHD